MNRFLISAWSISGEEARGPRAPGGLPVPPGRAHPRHPPRLVPHLRGDHVLIRHSGLGPPVSQHLQVSHENSFYRGLNFSKFAGICIQNVSLFEIDGVLELKMYCLIELDNNPKSDDISCMFW